MSDFKNDERFFRKIPNNPIMVKEDNTISSAVFKDSQGCSVDRMSYRSLTETRNNMIDRFINCKSGIIGIADITYQDCVQTEVLVKECPMSENEFHCELHKDEFNVQLSQKQAKNLARCANVYWIDQTK